MFGRDKSNGRDADVPGGKRVVAEILDVLRSEDVAFDRGEAFYKRLIWFVLPAAGLAVVAVLIGLPLDWNGWWMGILGLVAATLCVATLMLRVVNKAEGAVDVSIPRKWTNLALKYQEAYPDEYWQAEKLRDKERAAARAARTADERAQARREVDRLRAKAQGKCAR